MRILLFLNSLIPVSNYGGTQRVMWSLGKALTQMGHKVYFLAKAGSTCDFASVIPYDSAVDLIKQIPQDVDVVHFNGTAPCGFEKPYVVTYHGNFMGGDLDRNAIFVSKDHASRYNSDSFVYNGLDWDEYGPVDLNASRHYYHFLGKAAWRVKNVQGAIDVVKALPNEKIYILGGYRFNFKMGMRFTVTSKTRFKGMVGGVKKNRYLQHSKGLIFPVKWDEPFGLAITESLYFGAPVFATPYGSLPELVKPEVGFLTDSESEMILHLKEGVVYSPMICHEYARDLFNAEIMAKAYLQKYEKVLNGEYLNENYPHALVPDSKRPWKK